MDILGLILNGVLTTILGTIVTNILVYIIAPDWLKYYIIKYFHFLNFVTIPKIVISGTWDAEYCKDGEPNEKYAQNIKLCQLGKSIIGFHTTDGAEKFKIIGKIVMDQYFEGSYTDERDGKSFHGTFQVVVYHKATGKLFDEMKGRWIGFNSSKENINYGTWMWKKTEIPPPIGE